MYGDLLALTLTEGPYFVDEDLNRSDIRFDANGVLQAGLPLSLAINVARLADCNPVPLTEAYVDIWHLQCRRRLLRRCRPERNQHWLSSWLSTYRSPWERELPHYLSRLVSGRAVHIHVKVRTFNGTSETYEFASHFFMDEAFTDEIYRQARYNTRDARDTRITSNGIYNGGSSLAGITSNSGSQLMLTLRNKGAWVESKRSAYSRSEPWKFAGPSARCAWSRRTGRPPGGGTPPIGQ